MRTLTNRRITWERWAVHPVWTSEAGTVWASRTIDGSRKVEYFYMRAEYDSPANGPCGPTSSLHDAMDTCERGV